MKTWKLVSGILSIIMSAFVLFQSSIAGLSNALEENGEVGGSAGLIVAAFLLAGGIMSIATKNSNKKGGNIALVVMFALAAIMGFALAGSYSDLKVWSAWCLLCAVLAIIALIRGKKTNA